MTSYIDKGKMFLQQNEFSKAMEYFQAALESMESPKDAYFGLAESYFALGKDERGKVSLFKAMALDPNNEYGLSLIRIHCFSKENSSASTAIALDKRDDLDPVISIKTWPKLGAKHYVAEQQSGNRLYFRIGAKGCTIECPTEDGWEGHKEPTGKVYIPDFFNIKGNIYKSITIGNDAFCDCESIVEIILPKELQRIEANAFEGTSISSIDLPTTLEHIEDSAFHITDLEVVTIPNSVKTIGRSCFECHNLCELQLNEGLLSIGDWAFHFSKIKEVDIPASVTSIGFNAFPEKTIVRFHGAPPKIDLGDMDKYIVYVKRNKEFLYEKDEDWEDVKYQTF